MHVALAPQLPRDTATNVAQQSSRTVLASQWALITGVRYPIDLLEKRTLITASERASLCFFHNFLAPLGCLPWLLKTHFFSKSGVLEVSAPLSFTWSCTWRCWLQVRSLELALYSAITVSSTYYDRWRSRKQREVDTKVCKHQRGEKYRNICSFPEDMSSPVFFRN